MNDKQNAVEAGKKLTQIIYKMSGTKKRHDDLTTRIFTEKNLAINSFNLASLSLSLHRKLKKNEGFVINHVFYMKLFNRKPDEPEVALLFDALVPYKLHVVPIYILSNDSHLAAYIIVHRNKYIANEYADDMREIMTGKPRGENPKLSLINTAMKIQDQIKSYGTARISKYDIKDMLQKLSNDDVYFISKSFCMVYRIDPKDLAEYLSSKGFEIEIQVNDGARNSEKFEAYKEFDAMFGLTVSRTEKGLDTAKNNLDLVFRISETIDSELSDYLKSNNSDASTKETLH